ncbi:MAG: hypothetical protein SFY66_23335 [Oculatellaceae cyanobacterium bins.114]|nr:hypothetical protein [Oculatellaceae cyanobacterium bins.114]
MSVLGMYPKQPEIWSIEAGRMGELSDHPTTQAMLREILKRRD